MEGLAESFAASFAVSSEPNDTAAPHPRMVQYKVKPLNTPDQHLRRERMLEEQRKRRRDVVNYARKLVEGSLDIEDVNTEEMKSVEEHDQDGGRGTYKRRKFNQYAYQLMLSEWLVDVPDDLEEEWLMVVCPVGKRNLVIASDGFTAAYTKSGYRVNKFSSLLPGGSPRTLKPGEYTILDCIFSELTNTFYVLDVMSWRGHPVYDSETDFRFYWLQTKLQEEPQVTQVSSDNPYRFESLSFCPCKSDAIQQAVSSPAPFQVDGLLFFHKRTHYTCGRTPLVGWLKPHMLPEILGVPVPDDVMAGAPEVNKLTLLKANKDLNEGDQEKNKETVEYEEGERMDTSGSRRRGGRNRKKKNRKEKGTSNEAEMGERVSEAHALEETEVGEEMETSQKSRRSRGRRKKPNQDMDTSQVDDKQ